MLPFEEVLFSYEFILESLFSASFFYPLKKSPEFPDVFTCIDFYLLKKLVDFGLDDF